MSALLQFTEIFRNSEMLGVQRTLLDELSQRLLGDRVCSDPQRRRGSIERLPLWAAV
jgi:hypothetical protein